MARDNLDDHYSFIEELILDAGKVRKIIVDLNIDWCVLNKQICVIEGDSECSW